MEYSRTDTHSMEAEEATNSGTLVSFPDPDRQESQHHEEEEDRLNEDEADRSREGQESSSSSLPSSSIGQKEILRAMAVVERDSVAIADSFSSLFETLRLALSEVTGRSVDHVRCFSDAAGHLQESALDAATKGNRYINSCLRLNEEMRGIDTLAMQLKSLKRNVDALDSAVNRLVRLP